MSFREMNLRFHNSQTEPEQNLWQTLISNQSPVMKLWMVIMVLNLLFIVTQLI